MTYAAIHQRLALKDRGLCSCGAPAKEWALKQNASMVLTDSNGLAYSTSERDYKPMCVKCHRRADGNAQTMWDRHRDYLMTSRCRGANHVGNSKLTLKQVIAIKKRLAKGETGRDLSKTFNVSEGTISMIRNNKRWNTKLQSNQQHGFSLVELMIVVAIIGILAAIALPAYQDYAIRAKVTELVAAATACKVSVTEYYQAQSAFPPTQAAAGCSDQQTRYVSKLTVAPDTGVITVTALTGPQAIDPKAAGDYVLSPAVNANGQVEWKCNTAAGSTIPLKYLPPICRT